MPSVGCSFADSRAAALAADRGDLELVSCQGCGHVFNRAFDLGRAVYAPGYDNALDFSPRHRKEMEAIANRLIERYGLHGKSILKIGCGVLRVDVIERWRHELSRLSGRGKRSVLWGAGTKAITFLNLLQVGADDGIEYTVDINPRKAGRFIPGSAQEIVTPDFLREYRPDAVIVTNGEYLPEIRAALSAMNLDSSVMVATTALS